MTCIPLFAIVSIAALAATPGSARDKAGEKLSKAIHREMAAQGPIVTDADHALIARKCGDTPGMKNADIHIDDDTLHCANGRHVAMDGELRAMTRRISARAQRHADRAMKSAAVAEAQARVAEEAAARAMKEARAALRQR
ncbi:hypothetical protein OK349_15365 [Sphingomonas sp. BT-65]|uniref:hypothetical protein n=1 Tax=Sphingomonas sp. BT-65 TaxID=2989821 RepID=UPI00223557EF|nr:hypothetical protein [Sphingomonas sp. BT-65]MCW4463092.1 hypothetical protein [Sphingomonas sp. BT-65]